MKEKYSRRLEEAKQRYTDEVHALVNLVKAECTDIYAEVHKSTASSRDEKNYFPPRTLSTTAPDKAMGFEEHLLKSQYSASMPWSGGRLSDSMSSRRTGISGLVVAPEMLSPEETQELVRSILSRSTVASISVHPAETSVAITSAAKSQWRESNVPSPTHRQSGVQGSGHEEFVPDERHHNIPHYTSSSGQSVMGRSMEGPGHDSDGGGMPWTQNEGERRAGRNAELAPPSASFSPSFHLSRAGQRDEGVARKIGDSDRQRQAQSEGKSRGSGANRSNDQEYEERVSRRMERMIAKLEIVSNK